MNDNGSVTRPDSLPEVPVKRAGFVAGLIAKDMIDNPSLLESVVSSAILADLWFETCSVRMEDRFLAMGTAYDLVRSELIRMEREAAKR